MLVLGGEVGLAASTAAGAGGGGVDISQAGQGRAAAALGQHTALEGREFEECSSQRIYQHQLVAAAAGAATIGRLVVVMVGLLGVSHAIIVIVLTAVAIHGT